MLSVSTAIIPVAGFGTRLYPVTKAVPKALLPVIDRDGLVKPALQLLVAEALSADVEQVIIVTQPEQKAAIARYFLEPLPPPLQHRDDVARLMAEVEAMRPYLVFVAQDSPEGVGHAVLCAREHARRGAVMVLVGDHIFRAPVNQPTCAAQLVQFYETYQRSVVGVEPVDLTWVDALALIQGEPLDPQGRAYRVDLLKEKPGLTEARRSFRIRNLPEGIWLGTFGMDVLTPPIFDILDYNHRNDIRSKGEIQLRDAMETLVLLEGMIGGVVHGERLDLGTPQAWAATTVRLAVDSPYRRHALAEIPDDK